MSRLITSNPAREKKDLLTYEDYLNFLDNDGNRKEIIEGELFLTPTPSTFHQLMLFRIAKLLDDFIS